MIDDVSDIAAYYNADPDREDSRLDRHQLERDITWRFLERYLPAQGRILEVGAASGAYTLELARRGYSLTAVDLSAALLGTCRQKLVRAGLEQRVQLVEADARDLSAVTQNDFDAALIMGPLYHLIHAAERRAVLQQACARLRSGGVLFSAFISRLGILGDLMRDVPGWIEDQAGVRSLLAAGMRPEDQPRGGFRGYFAHAEELAPLHEALGLETLAVVGVEPAISADDESYNRLEGERRRLWLDLLVEVSGEPSILNASRHLLYIGRKK